MVVWFALLFASSSLSGKPQGWQPFANADKLAHACYFAAGTAAFCQAWQLGARQRASLGRLILWALMFAGAVGAFDEWHQTFTPHRSGNDLGDWLADLFGGVAGAIASWLMFPAFEERRRAPCPAAGDD